MKFTTEKIQSILRRFSRTLEERDKEDMKLYGWKGGQVSSYRSSLDLDRYADADDEEAQE